LAVVALRWRAAGTAEKAPRAAGSAKGAAQFHDFLDAFGNGLPLDLVRHLQPLAHSRLHLLAHLGGIEVSRGRTTILSAKICNADDQTHGRA
jgi:hypothetical protein